MRMLLVNIDRIWLLGNPLQIIILCDKHVPLVTEDDVLRATAKRLVKDVIEMGLCV